ncbi:MAG: S4 domain-containing protein [Candidatus Micrarchaeales archaeon]
MGNRGKSRHIKSLASPKFFGIHRKEHKYVTKPNPGRHTLERSVSVILALKKTGVADSTSAAVMILRSGNVLVNNRVIREAKFPIGLNDILEIKGAGKAFKVSIESHAKITFEEEKKPDYESQVYRVIDKYKTTKGQIMLRLHDGSIARASNEVKVNDSVILDAKRSVKKVLNLGAGAECFVIKGVHVGKTGRIKTITPGTEKMEARAVVSPKSGEEFETIIKNLMVIS